MISDMAAAAAEEAALQLGALLIRTANIACGVGEWLVDRAEQIAGAQ